MLRPYIFPSPSNDIHSLHQLVSRAVLRWTSPRDCNCAQHLLYVAHTFRCENQWALGPPSEICCPHRQDVWSEYCQGSKARVSGIKDFSLLRVKLALTTVPSLRYPGHQELELALLRLYDHLDSETQLNRIQSFGPLGNRAEAKKLVLSLASFFIRERGRLRDGTLRSFLLYNTDSRFRFVTSGNTLCRRPFLRLRG